MNKRIIIYYIIIAIVFYAIGYAMGYSDGYNQCIDDIKKGILDIITLGLI